MEVELSSSTFPLSTTPFITSLSWAYRLDISQVISKRYAKPATYCSRLHSDFFCPCCRGGEDRLQADFTSETNPICSAVSYFLRAILEGDSALAFSEISFRNSSGYVLPVSVTGATSQYDTGEFWSASAAIDGSTDSCYASGNPSSSQEALTFVYEGMSRCHMHSHCSQLHSLGLCLRPQARSRILQRWSL